MILTSPSSSLVLLSNPSSCRSMSANISWLKKMPPLLISPYVGLHNFRPFPRFCIEDGSLYQHKIIRLHFVLEYCRRNRVCRIQRPWRQPGRPGLREGEVVSLDGAAAVAHIGGQQDGSLAHRISLRIRGLGDSGAEKTNGACTHNDYRITRLYLTLLDNKHATDLATPSPLTPLTPIRMLIYYSIAKPNINYNYKITLNTEYFLFIIIYFLFLFLI